jgi:hypothetical protein
METPVPLINEKNEIFLTDADLVRPIKMQGNKLNKVPTIKKAKLLSKINDTGNLAVFYCIVISKK